MCQHFMNLSLCFIQTTITSHHREKAADPQSAKLNERAKTKFFFCTLHRRVLLAKKQGSVFCSHFFKKRSYTTRTQS